MRLPADLLARIETATAEHAARFPGDGDRGRQPVHTVYVPADRFSPGTVAEFGRQAARLLDAGAARFAEVFALAPGLAERVRERVAAKLGREPVEDLRIDFEDGYGVRDDPQEDAAADAAGAAVAHLWRESDLPPFHGLRVKSFADGLHERSVATLERYLVAVLAGTGGVMPDGFVVTFPKVVAAAHVEAFAEALTLLEDRFELPDGALTMEVQVETTQSIVGPDGRFALPGIVAAAAGRISGAVFGVYDYTAACGLPAAEQRLDHPACDFARHAMQVTLAGTGVRLSDGSTNAVPADDEPASLLAVWRTHAAHVRHSLRHGFHQGWDLHPSHLPSRFATLYAHHLDGLEGDLARLRRWREGQVGGGVLDEPATIRALTGKVRRAVECGALDPLSWLGENE